VVLLSCFSWNWTKPRNGLAYSPKRRFSAKEKVAIARRHLMEKVAVSDLCEQYGLNPTAFYRWQKELFEKGAELLLSEGGRHEEDLG